MKPISEMSVGINCAGESAADVANHLLADMRVFLIAHPSGQMLCDRLQVGIIAAIKESAIACIRASRQEEKTK